MDKVVLDLKGTVKGLKGTQTNQIAKLTLKYDSELELLEVVRDYITKRAELEHSYGKGLDKLTKAVSQRKFRKFLGSIQSPLAPEGDASTSRDTYLSFLKLLTESDHEAKNRLEVAEKMTTQIADIIKEFAKEKTAISKKTIEYGNKYQTEIWLAYDELEKAKAAYDKASQAADASQKKYDDSVKRPKSGLQALKNLVTGKDQEERILQLKSKWKTKTRRLNDARNEYFLALESVNAIQSLYYNGDLKTLMVKLDGEFYNTVKTLQTTFSDLEATTCATVKTSVETVKTYLQKIVRDKDVEVFLNDYADTFKDPLPFSFEISGADEIHEIVIDDVTKVLLGQKLGSLMVEDETFGVTQTQLEKELLGLKQMADVYTQSPQFGNAANPIEQKQDLTNSLDLVKAQRSKRLAQIKILKDLKIEPIMPVIEEPASTKLGAKKTTALFAYAATKPDELTLAEGDVLQIVEAEVDGWIKVKNAAGVIGLVPTSYVETKSGGGSTLALSGNTPSTVTVVALYDYEASEEGELSFKAGDVIQCLDGIDADEEWWDGSLSSGATGTFNVLFTKGWEAVAAAKPKSGATLGRSVSRVKRAVSIGAKPVPLTAKQEKAKVLYTYDATCDGELSIVAGEIIVITKKDTGSDAWWEGEGKNGRGQFPTNYVELLEGDGLKKSMSALKEVAQVRALYDFAGTGNGELSFSAGAIITLIRSTDPDWWDGELKGQTGAFPANYVERI